MTARPDPAATAEERLLVAACAPAPDRERLGELVGADLDWEVVFDRFERHNALPLLPALALRPGSGVPDSLAETLRRRRRRFACADQASRHQLGRILTACRDEALEVVVLKGFTLAERFYDDPSERIASDIDLLVAPRGRDAFGALLERIGFRPVEQARYEASHFHTPFVGPDPLATIVELHWGLTLDGSEVRFDAARCWRRRRPIELRAGPAFALAPPDEFVHLCWHAFNHGTAPLRDLSDIARVGRALDDGEWDEVERTARAAGASAFVALALGLIDDLWGDEGGAVGRPRVDAAITGWAGRRVLTARGAVAAGDRLWWPLRGIAYWSLLPPGRGGWSSLSRRVVRDAATPVEGVRAMVATLTALACCATMREPWRVGLGSASIER